MGNHKLFLSLIQRKDSDGFKRFSAAAEKERSKRRRKRRSERRSERSEGVRKGPSERNKSRNVVFGLANQMLMVFFS